MAAAGERVMVVAYRDFDPATFDPKAKLIDLMKDLTLMAMVGIVDRRAPRPATPSPSATAPASRCA
jgi:Ca2+-transporting ATPase